MAPGTERRVGPRTATGTLTVCADGNTGHPLASCEVLARRCNHSAFNGYQWTPSAYSAVRCTSCGSWWRTKAAYVDLLPDAR